MHPRVIEKVIRKAVADLEGREGIAFTTRKKCEAPREQSHVALTQQRWHWEAMTITDVIKFEIRSLVSRASCLCQNGSCQKQRANSPNPRKNEAEKTAVWTQATRISQNHDEEKQNESRDQPDKAKYVLKMKNIKKTTSTDLGKSQSTRSKFD